MVFVEAQKFEASPNIASNQIQLFITARQEMSWKANDWDLYMRKESYVGFSLSSLLNNKEKIELNDREKNLFF